MVARFSDKLQRKCTTKLLTLSTIEMTGVKGSKLKWNHEPLPSGFTAKF